jgi:hypothetical protein
VAGAAVGGLVFLFLVMYLVFLCRRRRRTVEDNEHVGGFGSLVVADEPRTSLLQKFLNLIKCVHICHSSLAETDICIGTVTRPKPSTITPSSSTIQGGKSAVATPPTVPRRPTRISNAGSLITSDLPIARSMMGPSYPRQAPHPPPRPPRSVLRGPPSRKIAIRNERVRGAYTPSPQTTLSFERDRMSIPFSDVQLPIRPERVSGGAESSGSRQREFVVSMIESDDGGEREFQETLARARAATVERIKARRLRAQAASKA